VTPRTEAAPRPRFPTVAAFAAVAGALGGALLATHVPGLRWVDHLPVTPMALCLEMWVALSIHWIIAARRVSAPKRAESNRSRALHLLLVNGAFVIAYWPYRGWPFTTAITFEFPRVLPAEPWLALLGVAFQAASLLLAVWARRRLGHNWSGEVTLKIGHELVRGGPYRRIRHPIYTAVLGMYVGPALVSGRLQGVLALAILAVAYARKIHQEERVLREEFGAAYDAYCRESWALIPWVV
jgi:protein-S-isoprenylcysteine O-methyltransferase Ste14